MIKNRKFWLFLIGAVALSFLLYGNSLKGGFVYDDNFFADRPELRDSSSLLRVWTEPYLPQNLAAGLYRPLAVFSFALNFILFGESPVSFHLVNIILNGIVIFLVFLLVLKIFGDRKLASIAALFFAFLPIHTESVAFIKSRDEILATLFAIWSWLLFISATEGGNRLNWKKIAQSTLLFLLAVFSKELIIIVPALFLAVFWIRPAPLGGRTAKWGLWPEFIIGAKIKKTAPLASPPKTIVIRITFSRITSVSPLIFIRLHHNAFWGLQKSQRDFFIFCDCRHLSRYSPAPFCLQKGAGSIIDKTMLAATPAAP